MATNINWYYHRNGCNSCKKMATLLEEKEAKVKETVIANKTRFEGEKALEIAHDANMVHIAKGKKLYSFDMKKEPAEDEELLKHMLGPHGNLRAPVVIKGKTVFVGFHGDEFPELM